MENKETNLIDRLSKEITPEAIQKTLKSETKRGYDTTGYAYQYCVDRFNEELGEKWGFNYKILKEIEGEYKTGTHFYDVTVEVGIWVNDPKNIRSCAGGHTAMIYADALKGAITNGFKKTAAFWGVGAAAFRGELDDDNVPLPGKNEERIIQNKEVMKQNIIKEIAVLGKDFSPQKKEETNNKVKAAKTIEDLNHIKQDIVLEISKGL